MSAALFAASAAIGGLIALQGRVAAGLLIPILAGIIETGIAELPWPFVLIGAGAVGWVAGGRRLALFAVLMLTAVLLSGLWKRRCGRSTCRAPLF